MSILIVTGIENGRPCADTLSRELGTEVEIAMDRKTALALLRRREFSAVIVDETIAECDPVAADALWEHAGLAIPVQVNFAIAGHARLIREIRAALHRREREQALARRAAVLTLESDLKSTIAGLLLHTELALSETDANLAERVRKIASLLEELRRQLAAPNLAEAKI